MSHVSQESSLLLVEGWVRTFEDVQADLKRSSSRLVLGRRSRSIERTSAELVDVGMVDAGEEADLWGLHWVRFWQEKLLTQEVNQCCS